jgi:hypothetical protein
MPAKEGVMTLGLSLSAFTTLHVIISLVAIAAGLAVFYGMVRGQRMVRWTEAFLLATVLTSVTGFMFPDIKVGPPFIFGVISLIVLVGAIAGLYLYRLAGAWRLIYVIGALVALYLNVVVLIVQSFQKLPLLQPLAPTQSEPPFLAVQLVVMAAFIWFGYLAGRRFYPAGRTPVVTGRPAVPL